MVSIAPWILSLTPPFGQRNSSRRGAYHVWYNQLMPVIGAHVPAAGGLKNSVANAIKIGAECMQIFGASSRQWSVKQPSGEEIAEYKAALREAGLGPVFLHAAYLVNLASPSAEQRGKSIQSLVEHLKIASAIGAEGLIFHPGSSRGDPVDEAVKRIASGAGETLEKVKGKSKLILENDVGGGNLVGGLDEIGRVIKRVKSKRLGVCIDTAHGLESGLIERFDEASVKRLFDEFDEKIGIERLRVLHVNDSKTPAGSRRDRHENIGEGYIGRDGFRALASEPRVRELPWIMEVPGFDGKGPDKRNVDLLRSIAASPS
ncbi:MAG: deoxyribonuclease IV [bacterium]|nr:deoxyribonuclease IV [bacterium]